jgi:hypothetical protein
MNLTAGIVLLVVFVAMLWIGKPRNGVQPRFMRSWIAGMAYTMVCLLTFVMGVALLILR